MRIAFVDPIDWDYTIETPYQQPLGGSQSALCYLAEALAHRGHRVCTFTRTAAPGSYRGVGCLPIETLPQAAHAFSVDVWIILNAPELGGWLRSQFGPRSKVVLWVQHAADQPAVRALSDSGVRDAYDAVVLVSEWQRREYMLQFRQPHQRTVVQRNAIAPAFQAMFPPDTRVVREKSGLQTLAYTSTPFRGLNVLLRLFPLVRAVVPAVRLKVFSSMRVYQVAPGEDEQEFGTLYQACRGTEGVEYVGSLSQPALAEQLKHVAALAYPNTFPETSCIAVMEAMAAGCIVVTSDLGALPETTAGFGRLVRLPHEGADYGQAFVQAVAEALHSFANPDPAELEDFIRSQLAFVNQTCTWANRAREWEAWLRGL